MKGRGRRFLGMFVVLWMATGLAVPSFADRMMSEDKMKPADTMMSGDRMMSERSGMLSGYPGHHASGKASISKDGMGKATLELTGIRVDKVPDGRVYLAKGGDHTKGIELGKLTQFTGDVRFPIPQNTMLEDYDGVVIWCKKFEVGIGKATFGMAGMK